MSSEQSTLTETRDPFDYTPEQVVDAPAIDSSQLDRFGLATSWLGKQPAQLDNADDLTFWRYQFDRVYFYARNDGEGNNSYHPVEFRTFIYTVGPPPSRLKEFIKDPSNPRLQHIYNSGPYEGYMSGFNFGSHTSNIEDDEVAADEASNLGIPQFEVLVMEDGRVRGQATGFFDPFGIQQTRRVRPTAGQEVWNLSFNSSRESYQLSAPARSQSSQRSKAISGKTAYINGEQVGTVTQDGRIWLKKSYQNSSQRYRGDASREFLVNNTEATYSALRDGGNIYKVDETQNGIYFATARAKPDDFDAVAPDEIDPSATGEPLEIETSLVLDEDMATDFNIRHEDGIFSRHDTPTVRSTDTSAQFDTVPQGAL